MWTPPGPLGGGGVSIFVSPRNTSKIDTRVTHTPPKGSKKEPTTPPGASKLDPNTPLGRLYNKLCTARCILSAANGRLPENLEQEAIENI